jgi:phosphatidyl-myo-inositol alpha-mannosyltransferase
MSAGAAVVASDLGAFSRVLDDGAAGVLFRTGDSADLARTLVAVLQDPERRAKVEARASAVVRRYDWSAVTDQVLAVYEMAVAGRDAPVGEDPSSLRGARLLELRRGWGEGR